MKSEIKRDEMCEVEFGENVMGIVIAPCYGVPARDFAAIQVPRAVLDGHPRRRYAKSAACGFARREVSEPEYCAWKSLRDIIEAD